MNERIYVPPDLDHAVETLYAEVGALIGKVAQLEAIVAALIDTIDSSQIPVRPLAREWRKQR
jgi:hypothetical protein